MGTFSKLKLPSFLIFAFSLISFGLSENYKPRSKLEFASGGYRNILIALSEDIDDTKCVHLIQEIQSAMSLASSLLHEKTGGRAYFSEVKILLPNNANKCRDFNDIGNALASDSFQVADIKITDGDGHPMAKSLPWTRQYGSCSSGAEDIFVPTNFVLSHTFTAEEKGRIFLHEWSKFRYGVFEEFGFINDQVFPPCYQRRGEYFWTSCTEENLPSLYPFNSPGKTCDAELEIRKNEFAQRLNTPLVKSSLMFAPHFSSGTNMCTEETHNHDAPTKQNLLCSGKSVGETVLNHPDFQTSFHPTIQPTKFSLVRQTDLPLYPAVFFIIENSNLIWQNNRLRRVKQSLARIVSLLPLGSRVGIIEFGEFPRGVRKRMLVDDTQRAAFIDELPDINSFPTMDEMSELPVPKTYNFKTIMDTVWPEISGRDNHDWHVVLITNTALEGIPEVRNDLHVSVDSMTIATFEDSISPSWLQMYTTPNFLNLIPLPNCNNPALCPQLESFLVDDILQRIGHSWVKVADITVPIGSSTFTIDPNHIPNQRKSLKFFVSGSGHVIRNPSNEACIVSPTLNYDQLSTVGSCGIIGAEWHITSPIAAQVTIYAEIEDASVLETYSSINQPRHQGVMPNQPVAITARVSSKIDSRPVISAQVEFTTSSQSGGVIGTVSLKDDGNDPDLIMSDGVYSAYITNFALNPTYHIGKIDVTVKSNTTVGVGLSPFKASLLDDRMNGKCCPSKLAYAETGTISMQRISSLIWGFRSSEAFDISLLPPSRIGLINVISDDGSNIVVEFTAPGANLGQGILAHYETCCSHTPPNGVDQSSCAVLDNCEPAAPGTLQRCTLRRDLLSQRHVDSSMSSSNVLLTCTLKGVKNGIGGETSLSRITIEVTPADAGGRSVECSSISGLDCIPVEWFWGLIGCIGVLVIIIVILVICWCVHAKKKKKNGKEEILAGKQSQSGPVVNATEPPTISPLPSNESPSYNVFVNKAYIQEADGQMRLVAAEGELMPLDSTPVVDNASEITTRNNGPQRVPLNLRNGGVSIVSVPPVRRFSDVGSNHEDMKLYKSNPPKPQPPPKPARPSTIIGLSSEKASAPIAKNRNQRQESGYANANGAVDPTMIPANPLRGRIVSTPSGPGIDAEVPIYASVTRNGRSPVRKSFPMSGFSTFRPTPSAKKPLPPEFASKDDAWLARNRNATPDIFRPPTRFDAFPSSESETYSDISRIQGIPAPRPPPQLPPYPSSKPPSYQPPPPPSPPHYDSDNSDNWDEDDIEIQYPGGDSYA